MKITDTIPMLSLILHLLLLNIAALCYRNHKLICFGILLYLLSIITFANYFQAVPGMMADRFLLVPSLGWSIVLAVIIQKLFKIALSAKERSLQSIPNSAKFTFLAILLFYSSLSFARNLKWKSYLTLFENDISYVDNSSQAHNLLALRLMKTSYDQGVPAADQLAYRKKAAIHFRRAVEIYPPFFNANYDLGRTYQILENPDSAIFFYNKALEINPDFATASLAVGELYMRENKPKEAIPYYQKVVKGFPKDYTGYDKLSYALFMDKDYSGSISVLKKANEEIPQNEQPLVNLYRVYRTINRDDSARYWLQKAIDLNPADQQAKTLLQNLK
jgi:tetratricopeptide (TPR) repeat protein